MEQIWQAAGAATWNVVRFGGLLSQLTDEKRTAIEALCPNPRAVYIAAFPYYAGVAPGNVSLYCRGEDYHRVLKRALGDVVTQLEAKHPGHRFVVGVDSSPLPERPLALMAGLGALGEHGLLLIPGLGSFFFLGTILTDYPATPRLMPFTQNPCLHCKACHRACPTGALGEGGFDVSRCLSHITQKKGALSTWEETVVGASPTVFGCDLCQLACPLSRDCTETTLSPFRENLLTVLTTDALEGLTNRQFREAYGDRAFSWRGAAVLRRNLSLQARR